ncbi:hypothetical protein NF867_11865 [Solitalea sp. MAHUQ-68]|uniref:Bacteriocin n=1 Tax=Solitalea agri TaxID=2953739 RepID=A0A9X2JFL5_9SPHI|nr:hypothetical protein [Solitalea agri]MCO4293561.1 hypothetical protein [Solitalea agri]
MKNNNLLLTDLNCAELLEVNGGAIDKDSWSYRLGHAVGDTLNQVAGVASRALDLVYGLL